MPGTDWVERLNRGAGRVPLGAGGASAEVLHWAYSPRLPDNVPHRHTYFEVCQVGAHGRGEYRVGGIPHRIGPGDLFLARPGVVHQIVNTQTPEMELFWVSFSVAAGATDPGDEVAGLLRRFADAAETLVVADDDGRLGALWRALRLAAGTGGQAGAEAQLSALMAALLIAIAQAGGGDLPPSGSLPADGGEGTRLARLAVRYIHDNLGRPSLGVAEVAAYLGLSPRHLTRLLRGFVGVPPAAYVERARLDRAATLLARTDDPIKQIALLVGYRDVHHFTRAFSRGMGVPPGAFRRSGSVPARVAGNDNVGALV